MFSLEKFREETIHISFFLFLCISIFYFIGAYFGIFLIYKPLLKVELIFVITDLLFYFSYKLKKITYKTFAYILTFSIIFMITLIFFFNNHVIYRSFWFIASLPFIYLYADKKIGTAVAIYSIVLMYVAYEKGFFPITFQDYVAYVISDLMVASISWFFITQMQTYEKKVLEEQKKLDVQAKTDYLTNVLNRRGFMQEILDKKGVLGVFDLDYFKKINDTYGHEFGDEYLRHFVKILKNSLRKDDIIGRFGGDEFVVLFINAKKDDLDKWVEEFYKRLELSPYKGIKVSVSIGLANYEGDLQKSFNLADNALYISKNRRNKVTFFEE
ncbi:GGDEF domain-containing protein [Caminibacter pacificus]|uniref:diguanylate cyclase n=2 Tax=Caminibacter pacificus TaxID=1424653 RepID=A0AAJ4UXW3_9BACT|nr:GGDEF domain-containing protein [Caminibacter pacificus]QCI27755.1 diguanylate cyclase [Caminibacter pacificus]ROR40070.1 diguanylate cyclase (GGDEF)-like protein [Caminibacter pacificus]